METVFDKCDILSKVVHMLHDNATVHNSHVSKTEVHSASTNLFANLY